MIGSDGNIYVNVSMDQGQSWLFGGLLPNPNNLVFTKVQAINGFPVNNYEGVLEIIALGGQSVGDPQYPYLLELPNVVATLDSDPLAWTWNWKNQLPSNPPSPSFVDFDIESGPTGQNLQLVLLGSDGNTYVNFQVPSGNWGWYAGHHSTGLP